MAYEDRIYTDLAVEATAALQGRVGKEIPGVSMQQRQREGVQVTVVEVLNAEGAQAIGKAPGRYVTIDAPELREGDRLVEERVARAVAAELHDLLPKGPGASYLVVGLGNWRATPDAVGPRVVEKLLITRHLQQMLPDELKGRVQAVAAVAPGVLGTTGIETQEIVRGVVEKIRPAAVIVVDALAARALDRLATTVQIADSGISPGSGIGNSRRALNQESLGIPVIAVGIPTVVAAATIAHETLDLLTGQLKGKAALFDLLNEFTPEEKAALVDEVLQPAVGSLVVTPKEVDELVEGAARLVAGALNGALNGDLTLDDLYKYLG